MAELYPAPFGHLIRRMFLEYQREQKIFDLPARKFFMGDKLLDTSVQMHGHPAASPLGPAAGPQDQMAQNIVLSWLAGSRILELKTVQINDELVIPRPCIDVHNIGYNIEWSQELKLEQSLREYVAGSMLIEMLQVARLPELDTAPERTATIFDMSVGYDLAGISTPRVRAWIEGMKNAAPIVEELRQQIPDDFAHFRKLDFRTRISDTLTLSTFHGCPAHEIESIVDFLLREMGVHVIIKLNPTLLGKPAVDSLLHDVMGYHEITTEQEFFDKDLQFDQALEICGRLDKTAQSLGRKLGVKFSNTLVVVNNNSFFPAGERVMYLSGQPLHVITLNLVKKWRDALGTRYPISFSAGIDAHNFANAAAMNFTPITTCTDLLRPGGYARLPNYMQKLESRMKDLKVSHLRDFILKSEGNASRAAEAVFSRLTTAQKEEPAFRELTDRLRRPENVAPSHLGRSDLKALYEQIVAQAGLMNTAPLVERTTRDERYYARNNRTTPRKIGSHLFLFDCINCDKCVPVCPNDANFVYETEPASVDYENYQLTPDLMKPQPGGHFEVKKAHQLATFQDFCNDCGNCDVFCPEDGGPYVEKPRFFGSEEAFEKWTNRDGFLVELGDHIERVRARIEGNEYRLELDPLANRCRFRTEFAEMEFDNSTDKPLRHRLYPNVDEALIDVRNYLIAKAVLRGVLNPQFVNYINVGRKESA
ncbi:MAG: glutamate synthase [Acidobacteriia bacterium]|nr:glutamate synthase [Terriglobia bacterium]